MKFSMKYLIILPFLVGPIAFAKNFTPAECPVVGNIKSKKFHVPGGAHYAEMLVKNEKKDNRRCFPNQAAAINVGYRKSKR